MEIEDVRMQIQSYLCQLGVKDLEEIAKTLGCSDGDTKEKNRKGLVRLIEEQLEGTLKGTKADKMERLEEFKSQIMEHTPVCPPLEAVGEETKPGISQPPLGEGKPKLEDVKPLYFQPSDFKRELKIIGQIGEPGQKDKLSFVSLARQRKSKLGSSTRHKNPKVNEVHASQTGEGAVQPATTDKNLKHPEGGNTKEDNFMAAIQEVRSELATLKESIEKNRAEDQQLTSTPLGSQNQQWYRRPMGCPSCQAKGRGASCDHCHICGSSDHWARGCRKKNSSGEKAGPGNRHGLRPRDRK